MAPKQPPIILPPNLTLEKLVPVQQLLHLTVHRNKNQHRGIKWFGNLQLLRRNVKRLVEMLSSKEAEYRKGKEAIVKMAAWVEAEIVPRVYLSFSAVVADNQYASLGLMLMGCLARVNNCISFPRRRVVSEDEGDARVHTSTRTVIPSEDMGEAVTREDEALEDEILLQDAKLRIRMKKEKKRKGLLDGELGESVSRDTSEVESRPKQASSKREVLDVEGSSEEEEEQKPAKRMKKAKKVSQKFLSEFDHLSGMSSSDEEPAPKKTSKRTVAEPVDSDSEVEVKPALKKIKKSTPGAKSSTAKTVKKKKKKGDDDFDDLFAGLM